MPPWPGKKLQIPLCTLCVVPTHVCISMIQTNIHIIYIQCIHHCLFLLLTTITIVFTITIAIILVSIVIVDTAVVVVFAHQ